MKWWNRNLIDCTPQAWSNGGGITCEIAAWPRQGDWQWRVSVARIDRDGPFSDFPGVQRWFAVLEGEGVELVWPNKKALMGGRDTPLLFFGSPPCDARLLAGPTLDFNLMARGLHGKLIRHQHIGIQVPWPAKAHIGVFACTDSSWSTDTETLTLGKYQLAWTISNEPIPWQWLYGEALVFVLCEEVTE